MVLKEIGERIRSERIRKGMSQVELARKLDVSAHFMSNIEQGKQAMNVITLGDICEILNVSADWILRGRTPESHRITEDEIARKLKSISIEEKGAMLKLLGSLEEILQFVDQ